MAFYSVGDSLASPAGLGSVLGADHAFGARGKPIVDMGPYFAEALAKSAPGDTIIISAGYNDSNGVIDATEASLLGAWIRGLRAEGRNVAIIGLREEWTAEDAAMGDRYGQRIGATTPARNDALRAIATQLDAGTGRVRFIEASIDVANALPAGEIHGNYAGILAAVHTVFPASPAPRVTSAAAAPTTPTPPPANPAMPAEADSPSTPVTPANPQTAEDQREAATNETQEAEPQGFMAIIAGFFKWLLGLLGMNNDEETAAPQAPAGVATTPPPAQTAGAGQEPEVPTPAPTPARPPQPAQAPAPAATR